MATQKVSRVKEGSAAAHGALWDDKGTNFTLFSSYATKVEVCLFDAAGGREVERLVLPEYTDQFWHGWSSRYPGIGGVGSFWSIPNVPDQEDGGTFEASNTCGVTARSLLLFART